MLVRVDNTKLYSGVLLCWLAKGLCTWLELKPIPRMVAKYRSPMMICLVAVCYLYCVSVCLDWWSLTNRTQVVQTTEQSSINEERRFYVFLWFISVSHFTLADKRGPPLTLQPVGMVVGRFFDDLFGVWFEPITIEFGTLIIHVGLPSNLVIIYASKSVVYQSTRVFICGFRLICQCYYQTRRTMVLDYGMLVWSVVVVTCAQCLSALENTRSEILAPKLHHNDKALGPHISFRKGWF